MIKYIFIVILGVLLLSVNVCSAQDSVVYVKDTLIFNGQLSVWSNYNHNNTLPFYLGGRYIPSLNYNIKYPNQKLIDFEGSVNAFGSTATHPFDTIYTDGNITPYRAWARYSTRQLEIRLGLQKINFGSATLLRPLMWFDQIDPRDPLKITNGVWGLLGRYYFLNNANMWLWCLYGNNKSRPWDIVKTNKNIPEMGARFQTPVHKGEMALSYHFRMADSRDFGYNMPAFADIPENRIGLDGKWDLGVGLWFEGAWINKSKNFGALTNQEIMNVGMDYTFDIGKGLNIVYEQLFVANDEQAFAFNNSVLFSGLSCNYPLGIFDNISAIVYYDWNNKNPYTFANWNHKFKIISFFLMAYLNPDNYNLPLQGNTGNAFAGPGFQIMLVYNH